MKLNVQHSLRKLESLVNLEFYYFINHCDEIKAYLQQIQLREKKVFFFQSVAERTNDTALYTYMKTTLTRQISLFVTGIVTQTSATTIKT